MTKKCSQCNRSFPEHLLQPMIRSAGNLYDVCPLCALKIRNKEHGLPEDTPFTGEIARMFWQAAKDYVDSQRFVA